MTFNRPRDIRVGDIRESQHVQVWSVTPAERVSVYISCERCCSTSVTFKQKFIVDDTEARDKANVHC